MKQKLHYLFTLVLLLAVSTAWSQEKAFTGGELYTLQEVQYGKFEARMKMAAASGTVSSMFLYQEGSEIADGRPWVEVDIEILGKSPNSFQSNIITGKAGAQVTSEKHHQVSPAADQAFHTYGIEWTPTYVRWTIDGQQVRKTETGVNDSKNQVANLIGTQGLRFNLWSSESTNWVGQFDESKLPLFQFINWVKVYSYTPGEGPDGSDFTLDWTDNFDTFDDTRWGKGDWTFDGNRVDLTENNVYCKDGMMILALTRKGQESFNGSVPVDVIASGNCGTDVTWTLTDRGLLTISGTGAMADYASADSQPWYSYSSSITSAVIEKGVTRIGTHAFDTYSGDHVYVEVPEGKQLIVTIDGDTEPVVITPSDGKADILSDLFADPADRTTSRALTLARAAIWYVDRNVAPSVNGNVVSGVDGKSEETAFQTLKEALDAAEDGDIIMIAAASSGGDITSITYAGEDNVGLEITQNHLTIKTFRDGEAIIDGLNGESKTDNIFCIKDEATSINIKGLTFKNAKYAIVFDNNHGVSDSKIDATFINIGDGQYGSAIKANSADNVDITGSFINNTAGKGLIQIPTVNYLDVHDAVFINNGTSNIFAINGNHDGFYRIYNNWFGSTKDNYETTPAGVGNVEMINWLFLDGTADPNYLEVGQSSKITFDLYYVDFGSITKYDGPLNIQLNLTQTLGELDKTTASLGEEITYTAKDAGDASVTATFGTASYTISYTIQATTAIDIPKPSIELSIGESTNIGAVLSPAEAGNLSYSSNNAFVATVDETGKVTAVGEGTATITVSFAGNENYAAVSETVTVTVTPTLMLTEADGITDAINNTWKGKKVDVTFTRTFEALSSGEGKASTVCLPFDLDKPSTATVGTFYTLGGVSDATGEYVVTMNELTASTLTAGTPYMFMPATTDPISFRNKAYVVPADGFTAAGHVSDANGWEFIGTYEDNTWPDGQTRLYGFAASNFKKSDDTYLNEVGAFRRFSYGHIYPFRCYLMAPDAAQAPSMRSAGSQWPESMKVILVGVGGDVTTIGTLNTHTGEVTFDGDDWYTLDGRKLQQKPTTKGMYIHNGRKVVIK